MSEWRNAVLVDASATMGILVLHTLHTPAEFRRMQGRAPAAFTAYLSAQFRRNREVSVPNKQVGHDAAYPK